MSRNACPLVGSCRNNARCLECAGQFPLPEALDVELPLLYVPIAAADPRNHPIYEARIRRKKDQARADKAAKKHSESRMKNRNKLRRAQKNERDVMQTIVRATARSGARDGDGDMRLGDGTIGIDAKQQSRSRAQFTVKVEEVDKAKLQRCFIVITTAEGRKFLVSELDFLLQNADSLVTLRNGSAE